MHTYTADNGTVFKYNSDLSELKINVPNEEIEDITWLVPATYNRNPEDYSAPGLSEVTIDGEDLTQFIKYANGGDEGLVNGKITITTGEYNDLINERIQLRQIVRAVAEVEVKGEADPHWKPENKDTVTISRAEFERLENAATMASWLAVPPEQRR